jgi:hypothetical protein
MAHFKSFYAYQGSLSHHTGKIETPAFLIVVRHPPERLPAAELPPKPKAEKPKSEIREAKPKSRKHNPRKRGKPANITDSLNY